MEARTSRRTVRQGEMAASVITPLRVSRPATKPTPDVFAAVLARKTQALAEVFARRVAVERFQLAAARCQTPVHGIAERGFPGRAQPGEPDRKAAVLRCHALQPGGLKDCGRVYTNLKPCRTGAKPEGSVWKWSRRLWLECSSGEPSLRRSAWSTASWKTMRRSRTRC